ncbi:MAG: hypothetical protein HQ582_16265, partial [Planctomycetes bacterium]|nr:hypothetical protein [Planctomycetota bacterium]
MRIKTILPLVVTLAVFIWPSARAGEEPKPANAKADYDSAETAAKAAEAAAAPLKVEAEKTRAAYLAARNIANDKRALAQQAKAALHRL